MKKQLIRSLVIAISFTSIFSIKAFAVTLAGDFNGDNDVDITDLAIIGTKYGTNNSTFDLNKDGIIDIYDIVKTAKQIQEYDYKVVDGTGIIKSGYNKGQLLTAVNQAKGLDQGTIFGNGQVLWDKNSYYLYNGETYVNKATNLYTLNNLSVNSSSALILSKNGEIFLDKSNGFKKKIGYAQYMLYLRDTPTVNSTHSVEVPQGALVELEYKTNEYYKVKYNYNGIIKEGYVKAFVDIFEDDLSDSSIGYISEKYESAAYINGILVYGNPGVISGGVGDYGGKSYGAWQLSSKLGSVDNFLISLKTSKIEFYNILVQAKNTDLGTFGTAFDSAWKSLANNYYDEFYRLQRDYIKAQYYDPIINKLKDSGIDYNSRLNSFAIRNMLWSLSVQHGINGGYNIATIYKDVYGDKNFINSIYDERSKVEVYFKSSSDKVKQGVKVRFINEKADCIRIYDKEIGY